MKPEIQVIYNTSSKNPEVTVFIESDPSIKPYLLKMFYECYVEVYVRNNRLKALLLPNEAYETFTYKSIRNVGRSKEEEEDDEE